ncbi:MAG: hypothetical protein EP338_08870, partial [Bacteroidetes bacterium]
MKGLFALSLLLACNFSYSQSLQYYSWKELQKMPHSPDTVIAITFKHSKLRQIPEELYDYHQLLFLDLSWNKLDQVPDSLARLKYLRELNLSRNKLSSFPDAL